MILNKQTRIFIALLALHWAGLHVAVSAQERADVRFLGTFTNMRFTEEHAYGYAIDLWQYGGSVVGLFSAAEGLQGDTPTGLMEKIQFDPKTRSLSFEARLTTGIVHSKTHNGVPSRDLFRFEGVLKTRQIRGRLTRLDILDKSPVPRQESIVLRREQASGEMKSFGDLASWKEYVAEILKLRGPKW